jgi:prevent-host-death family protein
MKQVNIHDAKTNLSRLLEDVRAGDSFLIAKAGKPIAKVSPYPEPDTASRVGFMAGQISVPDDFDSLMSDEIAAMFQSGDGFGGADPHEVSAA